MSIFSLATVLNIETTRCYNCGCVVAMEQSHYTECLKDHRDFWCPNGHRQYFPSETQADKYARLLKEEQRRHARTLARENEERAAKEKVERKLKRVKRGVCPECNRTFQNIARHMACKHRNP